MWVASTWPSFSSWKRTSLRSWTTWPRWSAGPMVRCEGRWSRRTRPTSTRTLGWSASRSTIGSRASTEMTQIGIVCNPDSSKGYTPRKSITRKKIWSPWRIKVATYKGPIPKRMTRARKDASLRSSRSQSRVLKTRISWKKELILTRSVSKQTMRITIKSRLKEPTTPRIKDMQSCRPFSCRISNRWKLPRKSWSKILPHMETKNFTKLRKKAD